MFPALTAISAILAIAVFAYFEFPEQLHLPKSWFRVLWGYPTFLNYEYESIYTQPVQSIERILHLLPEREPPPKVAIASVDHTQRCDFALSSPGNCFYNVTSERCSPNNRLPLLWEDAIVQCYDESEREVDCLLNEMKVENGSCQNVPEIVVYNNRKTMIYFKNVPLYTWHLEKSEFLLGDQNCSFVEKESLVANGFFGFWRPDDGRHCSGDRFRTIHYGIDAFSSCYNETHIPWSEEECSQLAESSIDFLLSQVNVSHLCKCEECNIPVLIQRPKNTTFWLADNETGVCAVPSKMSITFFWNDSTIVEVQTSFQTSNYTCPHNTTCLLQLESRAQFKKFEEDLKIPRFYLRRGMFHCPSEVTCWKELFYFVQLIDFHAPFAEFIALIPMFFIALLYLFKKHYTKSCLNLLGLNK